MFVISFPLPLCSTGRLALPSRNRKSRGHPVDVPAPIVCRGSATDDTHPWRKRPAPRPPAARTQGAGLGWISVVCAVALNMLAAWTIRSRGGYLPEGHRRW